MVEFQPFGPKLPLDPQGNLEHEQDMREEADREREAKEASRDRRPWWALWRRPRRP